jgi:PAS domain S-box-containing protein
MDDALTSDALLNFARLCSTENHTDGLLHATLPLLRSAAGATSVLHVRTTAADSPVAHTAGTDLPAFEFDIALGVPACTGVGALRIPDAWTGLELTRVAAHQLPGRQGVLVFAWDGPRPADITSFDAMLVMVDLAVARIVAEDRFADLSARVDYAQQLANMGDYDWHIASDTNTWSDQLYRIYGHEPQSFNASYERFLAHIHPDDRERISAIHRHSYETGEPYEMIERIVRPDGNVRYLASNGQVIRDDSGTPLRMRGTCIDITDRIRSEQEKERVGAQFRSLVEASPDAILLLDHEQIVQANGRATELFGGDPVGHRITALLPRGLATERAAAAIGLDGRSRQLDVVVEAIEPGSKDALSAVFVRDAEPRMRSEALAATLREVQVRRRQALEINDNVVQALSAARYALDEGDARECSSFLASALSGARQLMNDWLNPPDGHELQAGDLVRAAGSTVDLAALGHPAVPKIATPTPRSARIVIVDDNDDVRRLLRMQIERLGRYDIVGEGVDGVHAVEVVSETQPDVVFLDLAMPRMDGLEALPLIRDAAPGARVVVLSGFDQGTIASKAIEAGAVRYIEKGLRINFAEVIDQALSVA